MDWKNPELKILGLDSKEISILNLLKEPMSIQTLAKKSPIPRTTIAYNLNNLLSRNLVDKIGFGKRFLYQSVREVATLKNSRDGQSTNIKMYKGADEIFAVQIELLSKTKDERVYGLQPNKSWSALHEKVSPENIMKLNKIIRENNLILEGILERDSYEQFTKSAGRKNKYKDVVKSFGNRMADYAFAPEGYLCDPVDLWIIKKTALFINWQEEYAIKINDTPIANILLDLFRLAKEHGRKIDHNEVIRSLAK